MRKILSLPSTREVYDVVKCIGLRTIGEPKLLIRKANRNFFTARRECAQNCIRPMKDECISICAG